MFRASSVLLAAVALSLFCKDRAMAQDKLVGTYGEARTVLAFQMRDEALEKILPNGWEASPFATGPSKGGNLIVNFMDWVAVLDGDGKPEKTYRSVGFTIPAKQAGADKTVSMSIMGLAAPADYAPGPYWNSLGAKAVVSRRLWTEDDGIARADESWAFDDSGGESARLQVQFERGIAAMTSGQAVVHSNVKPEFYRLYKTEQAVDVVRSDPLGIDHIRNYFFKASGPRLSTIFDGTERLVSVTSLPWFTRQAFLPGTDH